VKNNHQIRQCGDDEELMVGAGIKYRSNSKCFSDGVCSNEKDMSLDSAVRNLEF
jgi:hypothetical protein